MMSGHKPVVAVIGAGPAGLYAAQYLADNGMDVVILNRDIKPGGLAEYGIYWNKYKMKSGLRNQFRKILASPAISYFGQVTVGDEADLTLKDLFGMGFTAVLVAVGAQGTKWLGLPGEELRGVYHAKDLVYHYNKLPPYSEQEFHIGKRVAIIGVGNVMMDIANWMIRVRQVDEVVAVARRDPSAVKFTKKELEGVAKNLDLAALDAEIARCAPVMTAVGQDPEAAKAFILSGLPKADEAVSDTRFRFEFLASPHSMVGDENGQMTGLVVDETTLKLRDDGSTSARNLGTTRQLDVDTVVFAIGDRVDEAFGLPVEWNAFVKNPTPQYPIDGTSYEAYDPTANAPIEGVFVAGWAREASTGLVGVARKDGTSGATALHQYVQTRTPEVDPGTVIGRLEAKLANCAHPIYTKADWQKLEEIEEAKAASLSLPEFKFGTNEEMAAALA